MIPREEAIIVHHRITLTHPDHLWTLFGIALVVLAVFVTACGGKMATPTTPTDTKTQNSVDTGGTIPYPPPIPGTGGPTSIEGVYQLTVTASPSCSLPAEAKQRTYTAAIAETTPGHVTVSLSGAEFVLGEGNQAGFEGIRDGNTIRFVVDNGPGPGYWLIEQINGTKYLNIEGVALATIGDGSITGIFHAEMRYFVHGGQWLGRCSASDHRMTFVR
jgi:hypothetical protein